MTIKEFFNNKNKLAIRCRGKKKAKLLCFLFDKLGYKWEDGITRYINNTNYEKYQTNTCYTNHGTFSDIGYLKESGYKILEFKDIEVETNGM